MTRNDYRLDYDPFNLDDDPGPYTVGKGKLPTKVTGDFSTERLTRAIHKLFGGKGKPESTEDEET